MTSRLSRKEIVQARKLGGRTEATDFVAAHAVVRQYLSKRISLPPDKIVFIDCPDGTHQIDPTQSKIPLRFDISHRNGCVAAGFRMSDEVGIDVEALLDDPSEADATLEILTDTERGKIDRISVHRLALMLVTFRACKEAVLKCLGLGQGADLRQIDVSLERLEAIYKPEEGDRRRFALDISNPTSKHVLAVAVETPLAGRLRPRKRESQLADFL